MVVMSAIVVMALQEPPKQEYKQIHITSDLVEIDKEVARRVLNGEYFFEAKKLTIANHLLRQ